ncbi:MAG: flagellar basal body rod protein FlgC [Calditrichae bacterium]|nr:flagellar basal body rod protein FlgC [Calditrichota bacterium]MCB9059235.1 flagellar basal body rod protein FlgC [Calditrichia bacterium]
MKVQGVLAAIQTTVGGLDRQLRKLDAISDNIANAEKTPDKNGKIYKRKVLVSDTKKAEKSTFADSLKLKMRTTDKNHMQPGSKPLAANGKDKDDFEVVELDSEISVYEPNHPMADENGYVRKPDVNLVEEMVDLISASRIYEANVTVMNAAKNIAKKAMEI